MAWTSGAASDTGMMRERNEDRYFVDGERGIFLVVDGVGGHAAGERAAETAVEVIRHAAITGEQSIREAIADANNRIFALAEKEAGLRGMACVLTLAVVRDGEMMVGHVGDSRLYLIWNGAMRKLTSDHSPVGEGEDAGELTEQEAMLHPRRHEVFRDVGSRKRSAADPDFIQIRRCRLREDAAILLCSDGLTDHLTAAEIREIVERFDGDPVRVATELVAAANRAGGRDNITALFVAGAQFRGRSEVTRPRMRTTRIRRHWRLDWRVASLVFGILIGMLLWMVLRR